MIEEGSVRLTVRVIVTYHFENDRGQTYGTEEEMAEIAEGSAPGQVTRDVLERVAPQAIDALNLDIGRKELEQHTLLF